MVTLSSSSLLDQQLDEHTSLCSLCWTQSAAPESIRFFVCLFLCLFVLPRTSVIDMYRTGSCTQRSNSSLSIDRSVASYPRLGNHPRFIRDRSRLLSAFKTTPSSTKPASGILGGGWEVRLSLGSHRRRRVGSLSDWDAQTNPDKAVNAAIITEEDGNKHGTSHGVL
jgi:hypothetical protein